MKTFPVNVQKHIDNRMSQPSITEFKGTKQLLARKAEIRIALNNCGPERKGELEQELRQIEAAMMPIYNRG